MDKEKKLGQEPIFPANYRRIGNNRFKVANEKDLKDPFSIIETTGGISKRFYAACTAMQGLLANCDKDTISLSPNQVAQLSYQYADELLEQEFNN